MQYINFIRDIKEDLAIGRRYLPLGSSGLAFEQSYAQTHEKQFAAFHQGRDQTVSTLAERGTERVSFIPRRYRIPIMTAADMYCWTAQQIAKDPFIVYEKRNQAAEGAGS
jgi:phytoene synthase